MGMNPETGQVYRIPDEISEADARRKGYALFDTEGEARAASQLNRAERRALAREQRRQEKRAQRVSRV